MPGRDHDSKLRAVLSYYDAAAHVTPEGDTLVSEETLEGLGTAKSSRSLVHSLFGSLLRVATPWVAPSEPSPPQAAAPAADGLSRANDAMGLIGSTAGVAPHSEPALPRDDDAVAHVEMDVGDGAQQQISSTASAVQPQKKFRLTDFIPDPGYFLAGAIAGGVSRTATAPLDRLKVYLLVNTSDKTAADAADAAKKGRVASAVKHAARPFRDAIRDIFRSGGFAGFFAGKHNFRSDLRLGIDFGRQRSQRSEDHARDSHKIWLIRSGKARIRQL